MIWLHFPQVQDAHGQINQPKQSAQKWISILHHLHQRILDPGLQTIHACNGAPLGLSFLSANRHPEKPVL